MSNNPRNSGPQTSRPAPLDQIFDVLGHSHRRRILTILAEANPRDDEEFTPEELHAEDEDLELFTRELFHRHLPKLAEAGYIDWDRDTNTVRRGPKYDEIAPLVELMIAHEDELPAGWP